MLLITRIKILKTLHSDKHNYLPMHSICEAVINQISPDIQFAVHVFV